jgi:hypothetical protein
VIGPRSVAGAVGARLPFKKADAVGAQGAAQESPLPRSRVRIGRGRLPAAANETFGFGTGVLSRARRRGAGDQGHLIAFGSLYERLPPAGKSLTTSGVIRLMSARFPGCRRPQPVD